MSAAQRFHRSPSVWPTSGTSNTQSGEPGRPRAQRVLDHAAQLVRRRRRRRAPRAPSAAPERRRSAPPSRRPRRPRRRWTWTRSHSYTGQVVNTRIAAHSSAEKNGYSTRTQPIAIAAEQQRHQHAFRGHALVIPRRPLVASRGAFGEDPSMPRLAANLSMMFNEVPFLDRFAAAAQGRVRGRRVPVPLRVSRRRNCASAWTARA